MAEVRLGMKSMDWEKKRVIKCQWEELLDILIGRYQYLCLIKLHKIRHARKLMSLKLEMSRLSQKFLLKSM